MYAVMGVSGQVGGATARALLAAGQAVRAVVRDPAKGEAWARLGCQVAVASLEDAAALARAFDGADGVFMMQPPDYDPLPGFPGVHRHLAALLEGAIAATPGRVVFMSTVGGHVERFSLLSNARITETGLAALPMPVAFLRPAWFMENAAWDVPAAREGVLRSFLQPLDRAIPMVATADIGQAAAALLQETWEGRRVVELAGPHDYSPEDLAAAFAGALGHPVRAEAVPRASWEALFRSQGMCYPGPRIRMLDGFNEGWLTFEGAPVLSTTTLEEVVRGLL